MNEHQRAWFTANHINPDTIMDGTLQLDRAGILTWQSALPLTIEQQAEYIAAQRSN